MHDATYPSLAFDLRDVIRLDSGRVGLDDLAVFLAQPQHQEDDQPALVPVRIPVVGILPGLARWHA
jgi:hypothetical protein